MVVGGGGLKIPSLSAEAFISSTRGILPSSVALGQVPLASFSHWLDGEHNTCLLGHLVASDRNLTGANLSTKGDKCMDFKEEILNKPLAGQGRSRALEVKEPGRTQASPTDWPLSAFYLILLFSRPAFSTEREMWLP